MAALVALAFAVLAVTAVAPAAGAQSGTPRAEAARIATAHVRENASALGLKSADVSDVVSEQVVSRHTGMTHVYLGQRFRGVEVFNAVTTVNVASDGRVVNVGNRFVGDLAAAVASDKVNRSAPQAVAAAAKHLGLTVKDLAVKESKGGSARETTFNDGGVSLEPITAKLVYEPVGDKLRLAWQVEISEPSGEHWWNIRVDAASGNVLAKSDYVAHVDYNVVPFPAENPEDGGRAIVTDPWNAASPFGWHDTNGVPGAEFTITRGNNAHAYTDLDDNNKPDVGGSADGGSAMNFDFGFDPTKPPSDYRNAAVTNLFYWNNVIHDVLWQYGFDEDAGNFQETNYGEGGKGGDAVHAQAQDGGGTGNANFATPPDGRPGRMQMYEWLYPFSNEVRANAPAAIAGASFAASSALWGAQLTETGVTGDVTVVNDGVATPPAGTVTDGCESLPAGSLNGDIALVDRGSCNFTVKAKNAQNAGAVAIIIAQNTGGSPTTLGGEDGTVTIPGVMVSKATGETLRTNSAGLNVTLRRLPAANIPVNRDSDFDNGVITHEYGHGVSNRLTGGPSHVTCLQTDEQMGEGWSDFLALALTARPADTATTARGMGTYLLWENASGFGIRPTPYTTDTSLNGIRYGTPQFAALAIPHGVGYAWASMLWEVYWNLTTKYGFADLYTRDLAKGNTLALQLVMDGMKMQPCSPGFVDGRDAILAADQALTGGANQCDIWRGFAKRGLGTGASQGSVRRIGDEVGSPAIPASCPAT